MDEERYIDEWDEEEDDEQVDDYYLDPAFRSWEDVNSMFYRIY